MPLFNHNYNNTSPTNIIQCTLNLKKKHFSFTEKDLNICVFKNKTKKFRTYAFKCNYEIEDI